MHLTEWLAVLVTETFTYVHQPKTGGTFVAALLTRLHQSRGADVRTVWVDPASPAPAPPVPPAGMLVLMFKGRDQHGARRDIPPEYADRPVLATVRNPYDRYVSQYEFAWWRRLPEMFGPVEEVRRRYPAYPELTFAEFVHLTNEVSVPYRSARHPDDTPGFHTQQFVEYFFADPEDAYPRLADDDYAAAAWTNELGSMRFISQDSLNEELAGFLRSMGYSPADAETVRQAERIWPPEGGRDPHVSWRAYYSDDLMAFVRHRERRLFEWFPRWTR